MYQILIDNGSKDTKDKVIVEDLDNSIYIKLMYARFLNGDDEALNIKIKNLDTNEINYYSDLLSLKDLYNLYKVYKSTVEAKQKESSKYYIVHRTKNFNICANDSGPIIAIKREDSNLIIDDKFLKSIPTSYKYDEDLDGLVVNTTCNCNDLLIRAQKETWYYNEYTLRESFKRYATFCKNELIGLSDRCYEVISSYYKCDDRLYGELKNKHAKGNRMKALRRGNIEIKGREINDFYIKDLLTGNVYTYFRHLFQKLDGNLSEEIWATGAGIGKELDWENYTPPGPMDS